MTQDQISSYIKSGSEDAIVEDVVSDVESDCDNANHQHGPNCSHGHHGEEDDEDEDSQAHQISAGGRVITRNEKKARKILFKLGLKPIPDIDRVTIKRAKNIIFAISNPEVYQLPNSDTYIIFGEAKFEDVSSQWQNAAAAVNKASAATQKPTAASSMSAAASTIGVSAAASVQEMADDEEDASAIVDETGVDAKDIDTVMKQASVSRAKAVAALKEHENDIVNAIMALSM